MGRFSMPGSTPGQEWAGEDHFPLYSLLVGQRCPPRIVHRLDQETNGTRAPVRVPVVTLFVKNPSESPAFLGAPLH